MNGIILRQTRVRDNDAILDWLLDDDRVLTTAAFHIQGSRSFPNGLETFCIYEIECTERPDKGMARLNSAYSSKRFDALLSEIPAFSCACAALEAVSDVCPPDASVFNLFSSLLSTLAVMEAASEYAPGALAWFECYLLHQLGALPNLEICAGCAENLEASPWYQQEVGFLCERCAKGQHNIEPFILNSVRRLRYQTLLTTMQNMTSRAMPARQYKNIVAPVLRFLVAVLCDNSTVRRLKAHQYMAQAALDMPDLFLPTT